MAWLLFNHACYTLSRLKGIETRFIQIIFQFWFVPSCYTLSRLKGIETYGTPDKFPNRRHLLYTFPFEGNWNIVISVSPFATIVACYTLSRLKGIETQPAGLQTNLFFSSCYTLSRLKGIETSGRLLLGKLQFLAIHFPVWRELKRMPVNSPTNALSMYTCYTLSRLKGIETRVSSEFFSSVFPCYTLSRLKGIETLNAVSVWRWPCLLYTFPFEGNWNLPFTHVMIGLSSSLAIHFPVWRELKQIPVSWTRGRRHCLLYTFPFEGNGNLLLLGLTYSRQIPCYTLSRLKGIETINLKLSKVVVKMLAIHFPVWRELKQAFAQNITFLYRFTCYTLSRLKGIETWTRSDRKFLFRTTCYTLSRLKGIETLVLS